MFFYKVGTGSGVPRSDIITLWLKLGLTSMYIVLGGGGRCLIGALAGTLAGMNILGSSTLGEGSLGGVTALGDGTVTLGGGGIGEGSLGGIGITSGTKVLLSF